MKKKNGKKDLHEKNSMKLINEKKKMEAEKNWVKRFPSHSPPQLMEFVIKTRIKTEKIDISHSVNITRKAVYNTDIVR